MQPKAILFDCFGVLYSNALEGFYRKHQNFFKDNAEQLDELTRKVNLGQITRREAYDEFEKLGEVTAAEIDEEIERNLILDKKLISFIEELKKHYLLGVFSNAGKEEIEIIYRDRIDNLF